MARNDYHIIVYQILAYLYVRLKKGEDVEPEMLQYNSVLIKAGNETYWNYIIWNMFNSGLIDGITFVTIDGAKYPYPTQLENCQITLAGIEYLCDNSFMEKAKQFLKDVKEITPFCGYRKYYETDSYCTKCGVELEKSPNMCSEMKTTLCQHRYI